MLEGKLGKFYEEFCLLDQPFIKDQTQTIAQIVAAKVAKLGENITVRRFARFKVGAADWTVAQTKAAAEAHAGVRLQMASVKHGPGRIRPGPLLWLSRLRVGARILVVRKGCIRIHAAMGLRRMTGRRHLT